MRMIGGNSTFAFGIVIRSQESRGFHREGEISDLNLSPDGIKLKLEVIKKTPGDREGFDKLILKAGGFRSENEAKQYGTKIRESIYLSGLLSKIHYKIISFTVFEEDVLYLGMQGNLSSPILLSSFGDNLNEAVNLIDKLNNKQLLAIELYNLSHFEISQRAKFITLIIAIECLSEQKKSSPTIVEHIDNLIEITNTSKLEKEPKAYLKDRLINLKKDRLINLKMESHSASCKRLVKDKLKEESKITIQEAIKAFNNYYKIRGQIVHKGKPKEGVDLDHELSGLDNLVSKLLGAVISEFN